jgi:proline dehydrogenase
VGTVLQSYLYRTPDDVERCLSLGLRLRLVKGAYLEPASVAYPKKVDVDKAYVTLAKRLLDSGIYHGIASHDIKMIDAAKAYVAEKGISVDKFEFQMIYGVRRDLQEKLRAEGFNLRIYVPFGEQWYPYFTRRLAERPANVFFIMKSMFRG